MAIRVDQTTVDVDWINARIYRQYCRQGEYARHMPSRFRKLRQEAAFSATPIAHTAKNNNQNGSGTTTGISTLGADLISIFGVWLTSGGEPTLADSSSGTNIFLSGIAAAAVGGWSARWYYCINPTFTNASHTFSYNGTGTFGSLNVTAWTGCKTSGAIDVQTTNTNGVSTTTSLATGSMAPAQGAELFLWGIGGGIVSTIAASTGSLSDQVASDGATKSGNCVAYQIQTDNLGRNQTFSWAVAQLGATCGIAFRSAGGGTPNARIQGVTSQITLSTTNVPNLRFDKDDAWSCLVDFYKVGKPSLAAVLYTNALNDGTTFRAALEAFIDPTGFIRIRVMNDFSGGNYLEVHVAIDYTDGVGHRAWIRKAAGSHAASSISIDVDGASKTVVVDVNALTGTTTDPSQQFQFAGQLGGVAFELSQGGSGSVKSFQCFNTRVSDGFVTANSTFGTLPASDANTAARYQMVEGSGTTTADTGPNGYTLTLSNVNEWLGDGASVPGAPTIGTALVTNSTTVSVPFTAGSDGGATVTAATATSSPGGFTGTSSGGTPITLTAAFVQGQAYTFTVTQTNSIGTGAPSGASNSVTPNPATSSLGATGMSGFNRGSGRNMRGIKRGR